MDALSAMKMVSPPFGAQWLNPANEAGAAAKTLSMPDLDKISPGTSSQPLSASQPSYSFENMLGNMVNDVSAQQSASADAVNGLLSGKSTSLHSAMISMEEASVSFQMMVEVRNKILDSYQELMRMSV
jgi:flagellar hook-basal body complex protein FliE